MSIIYLALWRRVDLKNILKDIKPYGVPTLQLNKLKKTFAK